MAEVFSLEGSEHSLSRFDGSTLHCGVIVSGRVSLSRNLASFPFFETCSTDQRQAIQNALIQTRWCQTNRERYTVVDCHQSKLHEHQFLSELQAILGLSLVSEPPAVGRQDCCTAPKAARIRLVFNGEDHLRLDAEASGDAEDVQLLDLWSPIDKIDDQLQQELGFAFYDRFGFLTASPAETGTGLRASLLLHLPALAALGTLPQFTLGLARKKVALLEVFGDPGAGDFFRLTNASTLGDDERTILQRVQTASAEIVAAELEARQTWRSQHSADLLRQLEQAISAIHDINFADVNLEWLGNPAGIKLIQNLSRLRLAWHLKLVRESTVRAIANRFQAVQLNRLLQAAIAQEDYQSATRLRDRIKVLGETR